MPDQFRRTRPALVPQRARERMVTLEMPEAMALALRPELARGRLPTRPTNYASPIYSGESREEKFSGVMSAIAKGSTVILASLQRPWPLVGFGIDPGDLPFGGANTLTGQLFALVKGQRYLIASLVLPGGGAPIGISTQFAGAQCELAVLVPLAIGPAAVTGIRGTLWGSSMTEQYVRVSED
jgi:hypothetical protein